MDHLLAHVAVIEHRVVSIGQANEPVETWQVVMAVRCRLIVTDQRAVSPMGGLMVTTQTKLILPCDVDVQADDRITVQLDGEKAGPYHVISILPRMGRTKQHHKTLILSKLEMPE